MNQCILSQKHKYTSCLRTEACDILSLTLSNWSSELPRGGSCILSTPVHYICSVPVELSMQNKTMSHPEHTNYRTFILYCPRASALTLIHTSTHIFLSVRCTNPYTKTFPVLFQTTKRCQSNILQIKGWHHSWVTIYLLLIAGQY